MPDLYSSSCPWGRWFDVSWWSTGGDYEPGALIVKCLNMYFVFVSFSNVTLILCAYAVWLIIDNSSAACLTPPVFNTLYYMETWKIMSQCNNYSFIFFLQNIIFILLLGWNMAWCGWLHKLLRLILLRQFRKHRLF